MSHYQNDKILVVENLLPIESCDYLLNFAKNYPDAFKNEDQVVPAFKDRTVSYKKLHRSMQAPYNTVERILNYARFAGQKYICERYSEFCVPDNTELTIWRQGDSMSPHADNCWQDDAPEEYKSTKHPMWYRSFSGIFYLNDDYEGGEIVFKNLDTSIKPKKGMFVGFKADLEYTHQVLPVKHADRYTIAIWYSKRLEYSE